MKYIIIAILVVAGGLLVLNYFRGAMADSQEKSFNNGEEAVDGMSMDKTEEMNTETMSDENMDEKKSEVAALPQETTAKLLVAGGCFWCVEADLEKLPGVTSVVSGYAGGTTDNPNYQNYTVGHHREVVEVTYNPSLVSFEQVLIYAMKHMDPTDGDGSFGDRGLYYSPAFYYSNGEQKNIINNLIKEVDDNGPYDKPLAVAVEATPKFWAAEDYHQDYYKGTLSSLKYKYYRNASGRDVFISKYWGTDTGPDLAWRKNNLAAVITDKNMNDKFWESYVKPSADILKGQLEATAYKVTQEEGTERAGTSPLDKNYERGIYVDILSGEPLFSSRDKFDSGTGWPSFVKPISDESVTEKTDNTFFTKRTEVRSAIADNHLGHVFNDGPKDRGGMRYCMNGVALRFVPESEMDKEGYGFLKSEL